MTKEDLKLKKDYIKAIDRDLEHWFDLEVHSPYDFESWTGVSRLFYDLRSSEVAKSIGMFVFNEAFGRLRARWEDKENGWTNPFDFEKECYMLLEVLQDFVIEDLLPGMSISRLKDLLKALNKWWLDAKVNAKLKAMEEDFK